VSRLHDYKMSENSHQKKKCVDECCQWLYRGGWRGGGGLGAPNPIIPLCVYMSICT